jgi:CO/xanthine dehydrogenase Mo-binding subunit
MVALNINGKTQQVTSKIEVHIVNSSDAPGGIGEPGTSAAAPALTNAIFAATGAFASCPWRTS